MKPRSRTAALALLIATALLAPTASAHSATASTTDLLPTASRAAAASLAGSAHAVRQAPPLPAAGVVSYSNLKIYCTSKGSYVSVSAYPKATVKKVPKKRKYRDVLTTSYYQVLKVMIETPAGYGGTLWKTLAKEKYTQKDRRIPAKKADRKGLLPSMSQQNVIYNTRSGMLDYRVQLQVWLKRDIPGPDSTVWAYSAVSPLKSCVTVY